MPSAVEPIAPTMATNVSGRSGVPAASSMVRTMNAMMIVVPRLGWSMISPAMVPKAMTTGLRAFRQSSMSRERRSRTSAVNSSSPNFANSDGWNCSGPAPSHRVAPFAVSPTPGTSTSTRSPTEPKRKRSKP